MRFAVEKKILLGFMVSVIALALTGWLSYRATTRLTGALDMVTHTQKAIASIESVSAVLTRVETEQRGYVLTGSEKSLSDSKTAILELRAHLSHLRKLTSDNPAQQRHLNELEQLVARRLKLLEERIAVYQLSGLQAAAEAIASGQGKEVMDQVRRVIAQMHAEEDRLLLQRERAARESSELSTIIITSSSVLAIVVGLVAVIVIRRDLVLREQADLKLQESRTLLEAILDNTPAIVFLKDLQGRYLFVNRRFEQVANKSRQELRGKTISDITSPELADQSREHLQVVLKRQGPVDFEEIVEHPDGRRPHFAVKFPIRDTAGKIYAIAGISIDVTERKKAEAERDRFFSLSLDLLCISSADGYFKRVSPAVTDILGWSVEEFLARPLLEFVHPDDRAATLRQVEEQVVEGQLLSQFENRYRHKNGTWRVLSWRSTPQGNLMYSIARDVTEQRAADEQIARLNTDLRQRATELERANAELLHRRAELQSLFESLPGLYLILKPNLQIVTASDAYLKATMTTREGILGRGLFEVFPDNPDDPGATGTSNLRASLNRVLKNGDSDTMAIQKYDVRRPDGVFEERYWSPVNSPVFGADRQIEYIIHRVEDVTEFVRQKQHNGKLESSGNRLQARMEQMEAEIFKSSQEVQAANRKLHAANKELEAFSYSVSHDLRAPLRHIDGFVDLLGKQAGDRLDDRGRRYLRIIADAARQMGALIDDLLVFSRMGRAELRQQTVDLNALIHETVSSLQAELNGRHVDWKIESLPQVEADAAMLRQVTINLLSNAVKYTRPRDPAVIEVGCDSAAAQEHKFFVRDNGVGFDMAYADKLFGVFQRLHRADEFEGTGIGLANVRRIVARHGGRTWAEARVDAGATFFFTLPKSKPDSA